MKPSDETELLQRKVLESDDPQAFGELILKYQDRLERVIQFRMDPRLRARVDPADVLQDAYVEANSRLDDYRACSDAMPFFLWLRFIAIQKLNQLYRHHVRTQARDAGREVGLYQYAGGQMTSVVLAAQLLGKMTSPSNNAIRDENRMRLEQALGELGELDREVLALRHFEHLSNGETAQLLNLSEAAASNRYFRAVRRLKGVMERMRSGNSGAFGSI
jgi:RNA polymerase sigma-70 factor (ECF subfamily)